VIEYEYEYEYEYEHRVIEYAYEHDHKWLRRMMLGLVVCVAVQMHAERARHNR
jgi:hypothetical protein